MSTIINLIKENKKMIIIYLIIIIILIALKIFIDNKTENRIFFSKPYIYTIESTEDNYSSTLPYINIKGEEISELNKELNIQYQTIIEVNQNQMIYSYYKSGRYLSLIIEINNKDSIDVISDETIIYNIDIKTGKVLKDRELLKIFNISETEVANILNTRIKEYYDYSVNNNYLDSSECDYDCYLETNGVIPFNNRVNYYIKNNYLMVYKVFPLGSDFVYDNEKPFDLYRFKIKKY